jgi:hypothetical protein
VCHSTAQVTLCRHPEGRQLVTPQTAEIPAVTNHTTGLIQVQFAGGMVAQETGQVAGGFERGVLDVALLATEGIVDFGVTDDTIGHLGHGGGGDLVGFLQTPMVGLTDVLRVQMAADVTRRLEVGFLVDGSGQKRRQVAHLEVLGVAERSDTGLGRLRDQSILVAGEADGLRGQEIIGRFGAGGGCGVAGSAL